MHAGGQQRPSALRIGELHGGGTFTSSLETFVSNLGVSLSDEQETQLHGLLKRPNEDLSKRRKTETPGNPLAPGQCGQRERRQIFVIGALSS